MPQVAQTYAPWQELDFEDVICPLSAVSCTGIIDVLKIGFLEVPVAKYI